MPIITICQTIYDRLLMFAPHLEDDPDNAIISLLEFAEPQHDHPETEQVADVPETATATENQAGAAADRVARPHFDHYRDELPRHLERPTLNMDWATENPLLVFPAPDGGEYRIRHQTLRQIVYEHRPRTITRYNTIGIYHWPRIPQWMQSALEGYREN